MEKVTVCLSFATKRSLNDTITMFIPKRLQYARFRTPERFMIKARSSLMVVPLMNYATMNVICSDVPEGLVEAATVALRTARHKGNNRILAAQPQLN